MATLKRRICIYIRVFAQNLAPVSAWRLYVYESAKISGGDLSIYISDGVYSPRGSDRTNGKSTWMDSVEKDCTKAWRIIYGGSDKTMSDGSF